MESTSLAQSIFWLAVTLCVAGEIAIVRSAIISSRTAESRGLKGTTRPVEILWAVVPAVALAFLLYATRTAMLRHITP